MDQKIHSKALKAREDVLQGYFWENRNQVDIWKRPNWTILVFVSSTFTDTHKERDFLMKELSAELQSIGRESNVSFMFVDMRWGVRDENTMEHLAWISCKEELERCRNDSMDKFFLSLQVNDTFRTVVSFVTTSQTIQISFHPTLLHLVS